MKNIAILKEKDRYEMMKDNLRDKNGVPYEIMKFNSVKPNIRRHRKKVIMIIFFSVYLKMFEITRKNCCKCDLETIILNDSQYFWINLKDFEVETECNWRNIFNKQGNSSTLEYRKELTPNIQFRPDRIFTRNDLFERIIKSCKATNVEFLMLKEKLGLCPYEDTYNEKEFTLMPEIEDDIEQVKKENQKSMKIQQISMIKMNLKKYYVLLTAINLVTKIKQGNLGTRTLVT